MHCLLLSLSLHPTQEYVAHIVTSPISVKSSKDFFKLVGIVILSHGML